MRRGCRRAAFFPADARMSSPAAASMSRRWRAGTVTMWHAGAGAIFGLMPVGNPLMQESRMDQRLLEPSSSSPVAIPVLDIAGYLAGEPGALEAAAAELRYALENVGFFYLAGHRVPQELIDRIFVETKRFHALPLDEKMKLRLNRSNNGYMPLRGHAQRHTSLNKDPKPNENESFFCQARARSDRSRRHRQAGFARPQPVA